jgi:hypothetical protein
VFVAEKLPSYLHFYQHHKEFVHSLGKEIRWGGHYKFV